MRPYISSGEWGEYRVSYARRGAHALLTRAHDQQYTTTDESGDRGARDAGGCAATVMPKAVAATLPLAAATGRDHAETSRGA